MPEKYTSAEMGFPDPELETTIMPVEKTPYPREDFSNLKFSQLSQRLDELSRGKYLTEDQKKSLTRDEYEAQISSIAADLNSEIDKRVNEFVVPDEIKKAGEKYASALPDAPDRATHERLYAEWEALKSRDPRYEIAIQLASINLPMNQGDKEGRMKIVRQGIAKYLRETDK